MNSKRYQYEQAQQRERSERMKVGQLVKVLSFDEAKGTVDVQPLNKKNTDGTYHVQPPILGVPISGARGGGISMSQQYKAGDTGYIAYVDGDIDSTLAAGQETQPNTERVHSATDAVFIGGVPMGSGPASALPSGAYGFGTAEVYVIIHEGKIKLRCGAIYVIVQPDKVLVQGDIEIDGNAMISGNLDVDGNLSVGGNLVVSGTITPWPEV